MNRSKVESSPATLEAIAGAGHRLWCEWMRAGGWRLGKSINHEARTHPGLKPFEQLSALERDLIGMYIGYSGIEQGLFNEVDYALAHREWTVDELSVGLRVMFGDPETGEPDPDEVGEVVKWEIGNPSSGRVESITVKWSDGTLASYEPSKKELVAADGQ